MIKLVIKIGVLSIILMGTLPTISLAYDPRGTPAERKVLPKYCQDRLVGTQAIQKRWHKVFGRDNWQHMHHFCFGLLSLSKSISAKSETGVGGRRFLLDHAVGNFNYSLNAATDPGSSPWPLHALALHEQGRAYKLQGNIQQSLKNYHQAIKIEPKYARAYASLSDTFKELGDIKNAKFYLEEGLKSSPKSKALLRRYDKLGSGKQ